MTNQENIKIFFDSQCTVCSREINYYQSISPKKTFLCCDLHSDSKLLEQYKIDYKDALLRLHAIDKNGTVYIGIDAFALIWRSIPRLYLMAKFIKLPLVYQLSKFIYDHFAKWRFNRLGYCNTNRTI